MNIFSAQANIQKHAAECTREKVQYGIHGERGWTETIPAQKDTRFSQGTVATKRPSAWQAFVL